MYFQNGNICEHIMEWWMIQCAHHSRLFCCAIKCLWASPQLESSKSCFRLNHFFGLLKTMMCIDVAWCFLSTWVEPMCIYIYWHVLQLHLYVFICGHEDSPDSFQGLWEMVIFADLPENGKEWLMLCAKFQLCLCRGISPLPMEGPQTAGMMWLKDMMQCYMWQRRSRSRRVWPQIVLDDSTTFKSYNYWFCPLCQPPQEFHQCEALKILWPTLNKEFKQWNTRQNSWNGLKVVQQIVWKQLEFSGSKNLVLVTIEVNRSRWNRECYAPSRVGVRRI